MTSIQCKEFAYYNAIFFVAGIIYTCGLYIKNSIADNAFQQTFKLAKRQQ